MTRNEIIVLISVIVVMGAMGLWAIKNNQSALPPACVLNQGPCLIDGYTVDVNPRPIKAMVELSFSVDLAEASMKNDPLPLALELTMPAMDMGINRVKLKRVSDVRYAGRGTVPRCPSGKKLWRATVKDLYMRELAVVEFEVE